MGYGKTPILNFSTVYFLVHEIDVDAKIDFDIGRM